MFLGYSVVVELKGLKAMWFSASNLVEAEKIASSYEELGAYTQIVKEF
jgi:hypothetical protein